MSTHSAILAQYPEYDIPSLNKDLDKTKSRVFIGRNAAFFGPIMSQLEFVWDPSIGTAGTDGQRFSWNPGDYLELPSADRIATIEHEIQHIARFHFLRRGGRDWRIWNIACDVIINRSLRKDGHILTEKYWIPEMRECPAESEEGVYDWLVQNPEKVPGLQSPDDHMIPGDGPGGDLTPGQQAAITNLVVQANHITQMSANPGSLAGELNLLINKLLTPVVKWEPLLHRFFTDALDEEITWRRPSRRHDPREIYLPSRFLDDNRLTDIAYYLDLSGSITPPELTRMNSEIKFIKDRFNPGKLTIVTFDTRIIDTIVIDENEKLDKLTLKGGGGTSLKPVRQHIIDNRPTAAIIFSDLEVSPMQPLPAGSKIPVIWVCVGNPHATVPFGQIVHIPRER